LNREEEVVRHTIAFLLGVVLCSVSGCTPTKGYSGPELPPEQVATVYLEFDSDEIEVSRATSNGVEFGSAGITLLPGEVGVEIAGAAKETPRDCERCYRVDEYGYRNCLDEYYKHRYDDKKSPRECSWDDFTEIREECKQDLHDVTCEIVFESTAGAQYNIHMVRSAEAASLTAVQRKSAAPLGYGKCTKYRDRVGEIDRYVGSGSYTSSYGARPCSSW
jgi:hypothetical protein